MKTQIKHTSSKKRNTIIAVCAVICVVLVFYILEATGITNFVNHPVVKTQDQKKEDETNSNNKKDFVKKDLTDNGTYSNHSSSDISLSTNQENDGSVTILTELRNYSDGVCDITIKNGAETYTKSAPVLYQASFSTCAGFSIPANTMSAGTWQITLAVTSKGETNTKSTSAEVQ